MILNMTDYLTVKRMPRQDLTDAEIKEKYGSIEEFHAQCLRYIASQYNRPRFGSYFSPQQKIHGSNTGSSWTYKGPVEEMLENIMYFHGDQPNDAYGYMIQDPIADMPAVREATGGAAVMLPTPWEQGNDIYKLVSHMVGVFVSRAAFARLTVDNNTREGILQREVDRNMAYLLKFMKDRNLDLGGGVEFDPFPEAKDAEFEQLMEYLENRPQDKVLLQFLEDIKFSNDVIRRMATVFVNVIINRYSGLEIVPDEDGYPRINTVSPLNLILDQRGDNENSLNDRWGGVIEWLTPEEIILRYKITDEDEIRTIHAMAEGNTSFSGVKGFGDYNTSTGYMFPWWWKEGENRVACVRGYWRSYVKKKKGELYKSILGKDFESFKIGFGHELEQEISYEVVRQGVLIGNVIVKDYGVTKNIVRNPLNKRHVILPLLSTRPYTMAGYNKSIVDRLRQIQDKMDALEAKIADSIAHDLGNVYVFVSDKITADPSEFLSDIKKNRFAFIRRSTGEDLSYEDNRSVMEKMDMGLSQNIMSYVQLKAAKRAEMEEIASVSKIALGQQTNYVGMNTQVNTIAQNAKGTEKYFNATLQLYADAMQYAAEVLKLSASRDKGLMRKVTTAMGMKYLEMNKDVSFMDLGVRLVVEDMISEESRARLLQIAQAFAQNQIISPLDVIEIETAKTYTELKNYLRQALRRQEKKAAAQAMAQEIAKQQAIAAQGQQMQQHEAMKQQGMNQRHEQDLEMQGLELGASMAENAQGASMM
jgi:hypothetical protein